MCFRALSFAQLFVVLFALIAEFEVRVTRMDEEEESSNESQETIDPIVRDDLVVPVLRRPQPPPFPPPGWHNNQNRERSRSRSPRAKGVISTHLSHRHDLRQLTLDVFSHSVFG